MMSILLGTLAVHACPAIKAHFLLHLQANLLKESETEATLREFLSSHFCCCQHEPFSCLSYFLAIHVRHVASLDWIFQKMACIALILVAFID